MTGDAVAVLGTGIMGSAMARNLVAAGLRTKVWDRSPEATAPLAAVGALVAASPQDAIADARVVITMLPDADAVHSVMFDHGLAAFASGAVWAQMGTIGVTATVELDGMLSRVPDVMFVDAPVSGSKGPAEAGQLLILASGPPAAEVIVQPAFSAIGRKTVWLGQAGQGSRMKLVVNACDFTPEFPLEWALKDVDLAIAAASGSRLPMLRALSGQWRQAVEAGYGRDDVSAARLALSDPA
jgi:3-hydroxyisobutyrate dehydrogenase